MVRAPNGFHPASELPTGRPVLRRRNPIHPMRSLLLALVAVTTLSAPSAAQFWSRSSRSPAEALALPPRVPPGIAALVLNHADELAIADSQRTVLETIRQAQDSATRPWRLRLDSLTPRSLPLNPDDLSPEQQEEIAARRKAIAAVMDGMSGTNTLARERTMAVLSPEQQKRAADLEKDARKQADEERERAGREGLAVELRSGARGWAPED